MKSRIGAVLAHEIHTRARQEDADSEPCGDAAARDGEAHRALLLVDPARDHDNEIPSFAAVEVG
jgi:hypothetical protein